MSVLDTRGDVKPDNFNIFSRMHFGEVKVEPVAYTACESRDTQNPRDFENTFYERRPLTGENNDDVVRTAGTRQTLFIDFFLLFFRPSVHSSVFK